MALLELRDLYQSFPVRAAGLWGATRQASVLNGISLTLEPGEVLGIVGESGCGKSTLARLIMQIMAPSAGEIRLEGQPIAQFRRRDYFQQVQMIFQDPFSSLNPKMRVGAILSEMLALHQPHRPLASALMQLLQEVGLPSAAQHKYPHEFSGGQRQRIAIARALAARPKLLIADEPVSALDVSIQAQILNLLRDLRETHRLTMIFISHDLEVVDYFCDRIAVMYLGKIVEELPGHQLHQTARHPYTRALLRSVPSLEKKASGLEVLQGELPSPLDLPKGCAFYSRCAERLERCSQEVPNLHPHFAIPGHRFACFVAEAEQKAS